MQNSSKIKRVLNLYYFIFPPGTAARPKSNFYVPYLTTNTFHGWGEAPPRPQRTKPSQKGRASLALICLAALGDDCPQKLIQAAAPKPPLLTNNAPLLSRFEV